MNVKSKDYKAIQDIDTHLNTINEYNSDIKALTEKITELRRVSLSPSDTNYPYGKLLDERDEFVAYRNWFSTLGTAIMFVLIYALLFASVTFLSLFFHRMGYYASLANYIDFLTTRQTGIIISIVTMIVALVVFALTFRLAIEGILKFQHAFKNWRFTKKYKAALEDAYEKTQSLIEDKRLSIKREISELTTTKEAKESEIRGIEKKIMESANIPPRFIDKVHKIKQYFEEFRVDTISDAINLLVKEEREQYFFDELKSSIDSQQNDIQDLSQKLSVLRKTLSDPPKKEKTEFEQKVEDSKAKRKDAKKQKKKSQKVKED